jgi:hypothetical protein
VDCAVMNDLPNAMPRLKCLSLCQLQREVTA